MKTVLYPSFPNYTDLKVEDMEWLSDSIMELHKLTGLVDLKASIPYSLNGFQGNATGTEWTVTAGFLIYEGELLYFAGVVDFDIPLSADESDVGFAIRSITDSTDGHLLQNGTPFKVRNDKVLELLDATDPDTYFTLADIQELHTENVLPSLLNSWVNSGIGGVFTARRSGRVVHVFGALDDAGATARVVCNLRADLRPTEPVAIHGVDFQGNPVALFILANGDVQKSASQALTGTHQQCTFSSSYVIE